MTKKIAMLKPFTAVLLGVSLVAVDSCRKQSERNSVSAPLTQLSPVSPGTTLDVSGTLQVVTIAGDGTAGYVDASTVKARFNSPGAVATDALGNVFIADVANHRIRKMTATGVVSTFAGNGVAGYQDGAGTIAQFNAPSGVATDAAGNVYVADKNNHLIRKITPDGTVSTFAGSVGIPGSTDGPGVSAQFNFPCGVAVNASGNILVADSANHKIRTITADGFVSSLAGNGTRGTSDGVAPFSQFNGPTGVTADQSGNVYVADAGNNKIRKIAGGLVSTLAGGGSTGDASGFVNGSSTDARFSNPRGVVADGAGNVFVADKSNHAIRQITSSGLVTTLSGDGTAGFVDAVVNTAKFNSPAGIAMDASGKLFIADQNNQRIRELGVFTIVSTLAGNGTNGSATGHGKLAQFNGPSAIALDAFGNAYVANFGGYSIRRIRLSDTLVTEFVGNESGTNADFNLNTSPYGIVDLPAGVATDPSGNIYFSVFSESKIHKSTPAAMVTSYAGYINGYVDGPALTARFSGPYQIARDVNGNIFVADAFNNRIRKVTNTGQVVTIAGNGTQGFADGPAALAQFNRPRGVAVDASGNVYVGDAGNNRIRKITPTGDVSTVAGDGTAAFRNGAAATAEFNYPQGVAVDAAGNIFVADTYNNRIRKIDPTGQVSTVAGSGFSTTSFFFGGYVDGPGNIAQFNWPTGVTINPAGGLYVADYMNGCIRTIK